jgi:transposase
VEVVNDFPDECRHLLEILREVYKHDAFTRAQNMSAEERLHYHQKNSGPLMGRLKKWLRDQIEDRKVEPNSGLGEAIGYMRKHWLKLTLFLRMPGAVLDNNICERALKKAILQRKNALFYKTQNAHRELRRLPGEAEWEGTQIYRESRHSPFSRSDASLGCS